MKISLKMGLWFFVCILVIEFSSMMYLHRHVIDSRVMQELDSLKARGNSHRDVLETSFDPLTLHHIVLMESKADSEVVITNETGEILESSGRIDSNMEKIINQPLKNIPRNGLVLQPEWKKEKYIATISPINNENKGFVYMFKTTDQVETLISQLNHHFLYASLLIVVFMLISIFFLTRAITKPLISMKKATKKLSKGDFSVSLANNSKDEIGELSRSIQTLANDLNHIRKERSEFLASISHELRTPLTYIKGYSDIGRKPHLEEKERIHYFNIINEESDNLNQLVKELFDLARLDENTFSIHKERVSIGSYLQGIYERVTTAFKDKGIHLEMVCEENLSCSLDPTRFDQVLLNLLDNARKYSNPNTTTQIRAFKKEKHIQIIIKDEGIGIPQEDLPYVFERLYRVEKSRSRATGGFGLGLAIVKELVEAHGGEISVKSEVGEGTTFKIVMKEN